MTDIPLPAAGSANWMPWASEQEDLSDAAREIVSGRLTDATLKSTVGAIVGRRYWMPVQNFGIQNGTPSLQSGPGGYITFGWYFDSASVEAIAGTLAFDPDVATVNIDLVWTNGSTGTGNVVWRVSLDSAEDGQNLSLTGGSHYDYPITAVAPAQDIKKVTRVASAVTVSGTPNVRIGRLASDAADTLPNDAALIGLLFTVAGAVPLA